MADSARAEHLRHANEELLGKGELGLVPELFASGYVARSAGREHKGRAFVKRFVKQLRAAIPDLRVVRVEVLCDAGDTVAWERTLAGTHAAALAGIPPSGQRIEWRELVVSRFEGGLIAEERVVSELAGELFAKQARR